MEISEAKQVSHNFRKIETMNLLFNHFNSFPTTQSKFGDIENTTKDSKPRQRICYDYFHARFALT